MRRAACGIPQEVRSAVSTQTRVAGGAMEPGLEVVCG